MFSFVFELKQYIENIIYPLLTRHHAYPLKMLICGGLSLLVSRCYETMSKNSSICPTNAIASRLKISIHSIIPAPLHFKQHHHTSRSTIFSSSSPFHPSTMYPTSRDFRLKVTPKAHQRKLHPNRQSNVCSPEIHLPPPFPHPAAY
jgi:hypothetical protein